MAGQWVKKWVDGKPPMLAGSVVARAAGADDLLDMRRAGNGTCLGCPSALRRATTKTAQAATAACAVDELVPPR
jgi:hypothetical protein